MTGLRFVAREIRVHHVKLYRFECGDEAQLDDLRRAELSRVLGELEQLRAVLAPYDMRFSTYAGMRRTLDDLRRGAFVIRAERAE